MSYWGYLPYHTNSLMVAFPSFSMTFYLPETFCLHQSNHTPETTLGIYCLELKGAKDPAVIGCNRALRYHAKDIMDTNAAC
jgi:hypothetical protein